MDPHRGDSRPGAPGAPGDSDRYPPQIRITSQRSPRAALIPVLIGVTLILATLLLKRLGLPGYVIVPCAFAAAAIVAAPAIAYEKHHRK